MKAPSPAKAPTPAPAPPAPKPEPPKPVEPTAAPAAEPTNPPPTAAELGSAVRGLLVNADMEQVSMKSVRKDLETKFGMSLSDRKEEIKRLVTEFLESR